MKESGRKVTLSKHYSSSKVNPVSDVNHVEEDEGLARGLNKFTYMALTVSMMGGLLFGLDIGTTAMLSLDVFKEDMKGFYPGTNITQEEANSNNGNMSDFNLVFHITTMFAALIAGTIADRFGRKKTILLGSAFFSSGALWQACSGLISYDFSWTSILLGRTLAGIGNGFFLTVMPLYASELTPEKYRGTCITLFQLCITIGIWLLAVWDVLANENLIRGEIAWRFGFAIQIIPNLIVIYLALFHLPESPQYSIKIGNKESAERSLRQLTGKVANADLIVKTELNEMQREVDEIKEAGVGKLWELFSGIGLAPFLCGFGIALSQNITGVNYFIGFGTAMFQDLQLSIDTFWCDLIYKTINMLATCVTTYFVDSYGRKFLTVWGTVFVVLMWAILAPTLTFSGADVTQNALQYPVQAWMVLIITILFQIVFAITFGPMGWLIPSEVFPIRLRGAGMAASVFANMFTQIVLSDYFYPNLANGGKFSAEPQFNLFIWVLLIFNLFIVAPIVIFFQPETKNVSMQNMRFVFAYVKGGSEDGEYGTLKEFFTSNAKETLTVLKLGTVDANAPIQDKIQKVQGAVSKEEL